MKEDFLYYLWKFQKFDSECLRTSEGEPLQIISTGSQNDLSGPDFFNAHLIITGIKWAGNVEMHLKSSDWYLHHHETDPAYDNVILHVVWEHDENIFRRNGSLLPVFELKNIVDFSMIAKYVTCWRVVIIVSIVKTVFLNFPVLRLTTGSKDYISKDSKESQH